MSRVKKNGTYVNLFMETSLAEALKEYAVDHDMTLTATVERAARLLLGVEKKPLDQQSKETDSGLYVESCNKQNNE